MGYSSRSRTLPKLPQSRPSYEIKFGPDARRDGVDLANQAIRRNDARIVRSSLDEVNAIKSLLADVYKDAGDGRTLLRELVQNADDAKARRLIIVVLERGWPEARNSLLWGPALLIANDGAFTARDHEALHQAIGGSKAEDAEKIGRFGIGLKSIFHICEAVVYLGADGGTLRPGALNPWAGTGERDNADPLHPDWDRVDDEDLARLLGVAKQLLGGFDDGLLLWIPLRCRDHLDRAIEGQHGLGKFCPTPNEVGTWFGRSGSLTLLLAQCGNLLSIEADGAATGDTLSLRTPFVQVVRPTFVPGAWIGRYSDDLPAPDRTFKGVIENGEQQTLVLGVEALGRDSLRRLRSKPDWPRDPSWKDGRVEFIPRKALAHAAITILRPVDVSPTRCGACLRWAVFLPLDDDPDPTPDDLVVEKVGRASGRDNWDIILHGYFWPSQDRKSIPGVTTRDAGTGDNEVRNRWNRAVRDELLLPCLPCVLADAVTGIPESLARELLQAVAASRTVQANLDAVTRRHLLLPLVTEDGVRWATADASTTTFLSLPAWSQSPSSVRKEFPIRQRNCTQDVVFIDANATRLGGEPADWPVDRFDSLLGCIGTEILQSPQELSWVENCVRHVLGPQVTSDDARTVVAARWLAEKIGEGALVPTTEAATADQRIELRSAWRRLFETLPETWLVDVPVESQRAVVELAGDGVLGKGLLPIPFGRRSRVIVKSCG